MTKLIVALDVPSIGQARKLVYDLGDAVSMYKVGHELISVGGIRFARELVKDGHNVFLDIKLHDTTSTVERAMRNLSQMGFTYVSVHASSHKMLDGARRGVEDSDTKVLAVTVLTDLGQSDIGYNVKKKVLVRAQMAYDCGCHVVSSGYEVRDIRGVIGDPSLDIVVPGVRLVEDGAGGHMRVASPQMASKNGATAIVVGRPIAESPRPKSAALAYKRELA